MQLLWQLLLFAFHNLSCPFKYEFRALRKLFLRYYLAMIVNSHTYTYYIITSCKPNEVQWRPTGLFYRQLRLAKWSLWLIMFSLEICRCCQKITQVSSLVLMLFFTSCVEFWELFQGNLFNSHLVLFFQYIILIYRPQHFLMLQFFFRRESCMPNMFHTKCENLLQSK